MNKGTKVKSDPGIILNETFPDGRSIGSNYNRNVPKILKKFRSIPIIPEYFIPKIILCQLIIDYPDNFFVTDLTEFNHFMKSANQNYTVIIHIHEIRPRTESII